MKRSKRGLISVLLVSILLLSLGSIAQAGTGYGTATPYSLNLLALLGKDGTTDVYTTVSPTASPYTAPDTQKHVQLKTFDTAGNLVWTKNLFDVASPAGTADLKFTDLTRHQPIDAFVSVMTGQSVDEKNLHAQAKVLLRPDLTPARVSAPSQVYTGQSFPVNVVVKELNGDIGATASVLIQNGSSVLDRIDNLSVSAGGSTPAAFALKFDQPGTYTLTANVTNVSPADWDLSNNTATFTVVVVPPNKPVQYSSYYEHYEYQSNQDYSGWWSWWGGGSYRYSRAAEYFSVSTWSPDQYQAGGPFSIKLTSESGNTKTATFSNVHTGFNYDPATNTGLYFSPSSSGTSVYAWSYAGSWNYSQNWCSWWGCSGYSNGWSFGTFLNAKQTVQAHLDFQATGGTHYGGNYTLNLTPIVSYSWDNSWNWWWSTYHSWGYDNVFAGWGSGTTTW